MGKVKEGKKRPPIGTCWRIQLQNPTTRMCSGNYVMLNQKVAGLWESGQVFDELALVFAPEVGQDLEDHNKTTLHLEQMDGRNWYLAIGETKLNINIKKNGELKVTHYDGPKIGGEGDGDKDED